MPAADAVAMWARLDPESAPEVVWPLPGSLGAALRASPVVPGPLGAALRASRVVRPVGGGKAAVLLGAFDPLTKAHLSVAAAAADVDDAPPVFCLTKVLLARSTDGLLAPEQRITLLLDVADRCGVSVAFANRGTYLEVARAMRASGIEASFAIGADKLSQLADPSFYPDGSRGVHSTFSELRFLVVPRGHVDVAPFLSTGDVRVLDVADVFADPSEAEISASEVRRLVRSGASVDRLVPPEVARGLQGYTSAR